jgi:hypothetical protein
MHLTESQRLEEAVAHMIAERAARGAFAGSRISKILDKVIELFSRVKEFFTGRGITTAESVFTKIKSGEVAQRPELPKWGMEDALYDNSVMAAMGLFLQRHATLKTRIG